MRVFWPRTGIPGPEPGATGLIVGWRTGDVAVVVSVVPQLELGLVLRLLEHDRLIDRSRAQQLYAPFQTKLSVLGSVQYTGIAPKADLHIDNNEVPNWISAVVSRPGHDAPRAATSRGVCAVILFDPPNPAKMHYFTLEPMRWHAPEAAQQAPYFEQLMFHAGVRSSERSAVESPAIENTSVEDTTIDTSLEITSDTSSAGSAERDESDGPRSMGQEPPGAAFPQITVTLDPPPIGGLGAIVAQMNCVHELQNQLNARARDLFPRVLADPGLASRRRTLSMGVADFGVKRRSELAGVVMRLRGLADLGLAVLEAPLLPLARRTAAAALNRIYGEQKLVADDTYTGSRSSTSTSASASEAAPVSAAPDAVSAAVGEGGLALRDTLCTLQQLHLRLNQLSYLPHQYVELVGINRPAWHGLTPQRNAAYIRFYNMLWLATYDALLGLYLGSWLAAREDVVLAALARGLDAAGAALVASTRWLMLNPAGFKLNTHLARFMGEIIVWSAESWRDVLAQIVMRPAIARTLVRVVAAAGLVGGAALQLAVVIDLLHVASLHMGLLYRSLARVYSMQAAALGALFRVFRGRKFNALRRRVDHGDFDIDQLLVGTILFTVLLFLFPTVLAFYAVLAVLQTSVLLLTAALGVALGVLNYFPLFPLLLRVKAPKRLPSGVQFSLRQAAPNQGTPQDVLELRSQPLGVPQIFEQLRGAVGGFLRESFNLGVLRRLATGKIVSVEPRRVYRSLYSVLPSQRGKGSTLLAELNAYWEAD